MSIKGKRLLAVSTFAMIFLQDFAQDGANKFTYVDPTGTYILKGKKSGTEIKGNFAEIRVKLLDPQTIVLSSYFNSGYPNYMSQAFMDTIPYAYNSGTFIHHNDHHCSFVFRFTNSDVELLYVFRDNGHTCLYRDGTIATGKIEKSYDAVPVMVSLGREK